RNIRAHRRSASSPCLPKGRRPHPRRIPQPSDAYGRTLSRRGAAHTKEFAPEKWDNTSRGQTSDIARDSVRRAPEIPAVPLPGDLHDAVALLPVRLGELLRPPVVADRRLQLRDVSADRRAPLKNRDAGGRDEAHHVSRTVGPVRDPDVGGVLRDPVRPRHRRSVVVPHLLCVLVFRRLSMCDEIERDGTTGESDRAGDEHRGGDDKAGFSDVAHRKSLGKPSSPDRPSRG
ncbi:hypothetical protein ABE10_03020, partial [Bacillus toyonensis]|nr:hypothetical protein [Bacillus toyonensis]